MKPRNPIGALPLALSLAAAYVVVAGTAGYLTLPSPRVIAGATTLPAITTTTTAEPPATERTTTQPSTTSPSSTQPTTTSPSADHRQVTAPGGLTTEIPAGWAVTTGTVATTLVVTDPTSPRRELRLGGAPVTDPGKSLVDRITEAATAREQEPGHRRLTLAATTIRDHPAVTWEFDENASTGPKRVAAAYWEAGGVEYVLYSAGPPEEWELTRSRLARMSDLATP